MRRKGWGLLSGVALATLCAAQPALAEKPACSNVNAVINPANQTVPEVQVVNGKRVAEVVILNGTNSNPKGLVTCSWTSLDTPAIAIADPTACSTSFTAPEVGPLGQDLHFQLTVTSVEPGCSTLTDTKNTTISVTNVNTNRPPVAAAILQGMVAPYQANEGQFLTLDGSGSTDPDGDTLSYAWTQVIDPNHPVTQVSINNSTDKVATFIAPPELYPNGETLAFRLTVSDGYLSSAADLLVNVVSVNEPPAAVAACPATVNEGAGFTLDGTGSSDPDLGPLAYQWSQLAGVPNADLSGADLNAASIALTAPALTSFPFDTMTFRLLVTDNGNLSNFADCAVKVLDITPPVLTMPADITAEATSGAGAVVAFNPTAHDAFYGDEPVTCTPASGDVFPLDLATTVTCSASDGATPPNTATASFIVKVQDTTPPSLTLPGAMGPLEGDTLGGRVITFGASATDLVDGTVEVTCVPASGTLFPVGKTTVSCSATDTHSNKATGSFDVTVQDTTAPEITFVGAIADGSSFYFGSVPPAPTCTAYDIVSGAVPCSVSGYSNKVGTYTLTATAKDAANNSATSTLKYTVLPWTLKGFYNPIDMTGVVNTVKAGSTVPMKFEIFAGPTELANTSVISSVQTKLVSCTSLSGSEDPVDAVATGGTVLRYDSAAGQFIFNWQTPKTPGACYAVTVTAQDGSAISANFKLK